MRIALLSVDFGLLFLFCVYLLQTGTTSEVEKCTPGNCLPTEHCEILSSIHDCVNEGDSCCSLVRTEFRTLCSHHGGICRNDSCGLQLQRKVTDCTDNEVCCVLV